jgi:hypothetical protein
LLKIGSRHHPPPILHILPSTISLLSKGRVTTFKRQLNFSPNLYFFMSLHAEFKKFNDYAEKFRNNRESFVKQVLLMSSGLFGVLVSLHKVSATSPSIRIAFSVAILSLASGLLLLTFSLYGQTALYKNLHSFQKEQILQMLDNPNYCQQFDMINASKWYERVEKIGYLSLGCAVIGLAIYAVLIA